MRFNDRRVLALLAIPTILICAGTANPAQAGDDEHHAATAAPAHADAHKPAAPTKVEAPAPKAAAPALATGHGGEKASMARPAAPVGVEPKPQPKTEAKPAPTTKVVEPQEGPVTAEMGMKMLQEGNLRWVADKDENPNTEPTRRATLAGNGQKPFVTILTCADSRLPVERIFDRGVGELFVIRVAGNIAGTSETGTIEYAVEHIKTPLLVVMGHTKCGAVAAAATGAELHGALGELVASITPAVDRVKRNNPELDAKMIAPLAVKENVWQSITDLLKRSPEVRTAVSKGDLKVVGAVCDIATGKVEWMGEHPWQSELMEAFNSRGSGSNATAEAETHGEK